MKRKFKIAFTNTNKNRLLGCVVGLIMCTFIFMGLFISEFINYNESFYSMLFPIVFPFLGIILMLLALCGSVTLTDNTIKINYGLTFINKKIDIDSIIEIDYVKDFKIVPKGDPAKGDRTNTFKIKYNDADYRESQVIFISIKEHKEFLELIRQSIR